MLHLRRSHRHHAVYLIDIDVADDIALISQSLKHTQDILPSLDQACNGVGLYLIEIKTECMTWCASINSQTVSTLNGTSLKQVDRYKYLGSYISSSSEKNFTTRKCRSWSAFNDMHMV